jgi:hypothetical protein
LIQATSVLLNLKILFLNLPVLVANAALTKLVFLSTSKIIRGLFLFAPHFH